MTTTIGLPWDQDVRWRSVLVTPPADRVLEAAYVRDRYLRSADTSGVEDDLIDAYIAAATEAAEHDTGRALLPQAWQLLLDAFPEDGVIVLPKLPVVEVTTFAYVDEDGTLQTLAGSPADYAYRAAGEWTRAEVSPLYGESWPGIRTERDAVRITYQAGYANAAEVPSIIVAGIGLLAAALYADRTLTVTEDAKQELKLHRFWKRVP